jgi:sulfatase modifying factor 1
MRWILPLLVCAQVVSAQPASIPDEFGSGSNAFTIDFVVVGDVGNAPHSSGVGSVGYHYQIGKYEISENLITKAEAQGMASVPREFGFGDQPIDISWANAAKFVNFLNTSKGYPAAYNVVEGQLPTRNPNAYYYIPSDNEWVKAAHYKGGGTNAGYWRYATGSDTAPQPTNSSVLPNTAVYWGQFTQSWASTNAQAAGGLSPYGTMGQNGNFSEYTDTLFSIHQQRTRGGAFWSTIDSVNDGLNLTNVTIVTSGAGLWQLGRKGASTGFRVASVHDTNKPVLYLSGLSNMIVFRGGPFVDPSVIFTDNYDPPRTITTSGSVNTMAVGTYTLTYSAKDNAGNEATPITRTVNVILKPSGDEDNDGLNNADELYLGTNPYLRDTDNDGVNDLREVGDQTDPLNPSSFKSLSKGLVAYYPFNGNANDESGNGAHFLNAPPFGDDRVEASGKSAAFTSVNPIQTLESPLSTAGYTVTLWFRLEKVPADAGERLLMHGSWNAGNGLFSIATWSDLSLAFSWSDTSFSDEIRTSPNRLSLGNWHQLTCTVDPAKTDFYLDGLLIASRASEIALRSAPLTCGGDDSYYFTSGYLDDVRVYNRALSAQEVALLHANDLYNGEGLAGAATKAPFNPITAANWSSVGSSWVVDLSVFRERGEDSVKAQTTDGQSTYREYTVTGPAVVDFWWKVSSEQMYDTFAYSLNGVNQETISGEVDWTYRTLTLPAGTHTIRWIYTKDASDAVGQDAGWLDDFAVYPATPALRARDGSTVLDGAVTVDFGDADLGSAGFTKSLNLANEGYVPQEVELSLPASSPFTFEGGSSTFSTLIGRGENVNVPIYLATQSTGTKTALLSISALNSTAAPPQITLTGDVRGPVIGVSLGSTTLTSGQTVDMGLAPKTLEFTIRNIGNTGNLTPLVSATGNFQIVQQPSASVAPQGSTTFKVLAQSGVFGPHTGSVVVTSNDGFTPTFTIALTSKALLGIGSGTSDGTVATSGTGGAVGWDFATTQLPSGQNGQALKTGTTPNNGGSALEFTAQTAGVISWSWKVSAQENFDWLLCEVDGQEVAGISTKNGVWQTQVVNVPAGANVRWVYRKDASASAGEDAGYMADVAFNSFAANQSFSQWADAYGIYDPEQRLPKSGMKAMFAWLGGFGVAGENTDDFHKSWILSGSLTYRYPISKTADGTQQILYSPDMSSWTTRRVSQRIVSESANQMVVEATAPSGTKGFFKVTGSGDTSMVWVQGGILPQSSELAGAAVSTFHISKTEVTWAEWQEVRAWAVNNGYTDLSGVGTATAGNHPVRNVSWYEAVKWCNAQSERDGLVPVYRFDGSIYRTGQIEPTVNSVANGYRLPTQAEWEWAARGGVRSQGFTYSGSNDVNAVAWHAFNSGNTTRAVRTRAANELGIHDMSGNVWEWCLDPNWSGTGRHIRGGSWSSDTGSCAVAYSGFIAPANAMSDHGFRVARNAED